MLRLILARHAEADRGPRVTSAPAADGGLTATGRDQARGLRRQLIDAGHLGRCSALVSSPAPRAVQTADILAAICAAPRTVDPAFSELGELADGQESLVDGFRRTRDTLARLATGADGQTVVVVTHAGFIMASLRVLFGIPTPGTGARFEPFLASTTEWRHDAGVWRLERYNVTAMESVT